MEREANPHCRRPAAWWLLVLGLWLLSGCARPQLAGVAPLDWAVATSGAFTRDGGRLFFGIGRASGLRSTTLLRATADNQAQGEMADLLQVYLTSLAGAAGIDISRPENRQMLYEMRQDVMKQARIVDHRFSDGSGAVMALCRLDLEALKRVLETNRYADTAVTKRLLLEADQVHGKMADSRK